MQNKIDYLEKAIHDRVKTLSGSKSKFAFLFKNFSIGLAALGATNTLLIALSQIVPDPYKLIAISALLISATITVVSAWQASVNAKDKFVRNANALNKVVDVREKFRWRRLDEAKPITEKEIDDYFFEFRRLEMEFFGSLAQVSVQDAE